MARRLFTSESVSVGHPDKVCDQVSDAILDAYLAGDPASRVACETLVKTGFVVVAGEVTSGASIDIPSTVRQAVLDIGYDDARAGLDGESCGVLVARSCGLRSLLSARRRRGRSSCKSSTVPEWASRRPSLRSTERQSSSMWSHPTPMASPPSRPSGGKTLGGSPFRTWASRP